MKPGLLAQFNRVGAWVLLLFLVLPALIAIPVSLTPKRFLSMPKGELSLRHFEKLFTSPEWLSSFAQSAIIGVCTALLATILGTDSARAARQLSGADPRAYHSRYADGSDHGQRVSRQF